MKLEIDNRYRRYRRRCELICASKLCSLARRCCRVLNGRLSCDHEGLRVGLGSPSPCPHSRSASVNKYGVV